ncbi:signal peptidase I [Enterococcus sp. 9E7_DIV0242]|uniref:Signal peptidase I n=2 Tax=Candidatus Enterococcus clewellii TaxID=1834193 RepID=A0AAQ3VYW8_9ENTE
MIRKMARRVKKQLPEKKKRKGLRLDRETILIVVLFFAVLLFFVFIQTHRVDGESMEPTLSQNDRYIILKTKTISRYDIVTFSEKKAENPEEYVKRVLGIPGDRLWTTETNLFIRPKEAGEIDLSKEAVGTWDSTLSVKVSSEVIQKLEGMTEIPEGYFFVLGDNRQVSRDSRAMGLISMKEIEGKAIYRYFPFNRLGFLN